MYRNNSFFLVFFFSVLLVFTGCRDVISEENKVCIKENCFNVELAVTPKEKMRGLQNRESLCNECGMLFIFRKEGIYAFWMKDTLIPLDMIWIDSMGKIVHIKENAVPCKSDPCESYRPYSYAKYVLELNEGKVSELGLKIGDIVELSKIKRNPTE